jgi:transcriptional regulator with PAS, ATPase and Fis domain
MKTEESMDHLAGLHQGKDWLRPHSAWWPLFVDLLLETRQNEIRDLSCLSDVRLLLKAEEQTQTHTAQLRDKDIFLRALNCLLNDEAASAEALFLALTTTAFEPLAQIFLAALRRLQPTPQAVDPKIDSLSHWLGSPSGEDLDMLSFKILTKERPLYFLQIARVLTREARYKKAMRALNTGLREISEKTNPRAYAFYLAAQALLSKLMQRAQEQAQTLEQIERIELNRAIHTLSSLPCDWQEALGSKLEPVAQATQLRQKVFVQSFRHGQMVGASSLFEKSLRHLQQCANSDLPALIEGETGTGKELAAQWIHEKSKVKGALVRLNCAALPESLAESELFGSARGAFTGAMDRMGLVERVDGGTLFLDEIAALSPALQAKLLRLLDSGEYYRVGESKLRRSHFRLLSASCEQRTLQGGGFRRDLLFRIAAHRVTLPSLRSRVSDIPLLAHFFLLESGSWNPALPLLSPDIVFRLQAYTWPGNIRELRHFVLKGAERKSAEIREGIEQLIADEKCSARHAELHLLGVAPAQQATCIPLNQPILSLRERVERAEREVIKEALYEELNDKQAVAKRLCISLPTLYAKIKKLGLQALPPKTRREDLNHFNPEAKLELVSL